MVVGISGILLVLEYRIKIVHALTRENPNVSNHATNTACREGPAAESYENNVVSWQPVGGYEAVDFSDILQDSQRHHAS
jgi:hypothetical protein